MDKLIQCYGCGALVKDLPGEPHKYIGAAAGCWEIYGEILAKEYGEYGYPEPTHQLTVNTYAVQHPGKPSGKATQSVTIHLVSQYLILEQSMNVQSANHVIKKILQSREQFEWLEPPVPNGRITVADIVTAQDLKTHERLVAEWARDVWKAWSATHHQIEEIARRYLK
jgi:hypothetical protein